MQRMITKFINMASLLHTFTYQNFYALSRASFRSVGLNKDAAHKQQTLLKMADSTSATYMTSQEINITLSVHYFLEHDSI